MMNKNPFSLYDFLGYAIPGSVAIICVWLFFHGNLVEVKDLLTLHGELVNLISFQNFLILIIISYVVGHFISFLSTLTVERFSLWHYGYPSEYLLRKDEKLKSSYFSNMFKKGRFGKSLWRLILALILLPITLFDFIFGQLFLLNRFVLKNIDEYLQSCLKKKGALLRNKLSLSEENDNKEKIDFLRIIHHYEYGKNEMRSKKMDNYVALYGFLRSMTLIFNMFFMILFTRLLFILFNARMVENLALGKYLLLLLIIEFVTYVFFLSFMKFYRRFTLECFMSLITDASVRKCF